MSKEKKTYSINTRCQNCDKLQEIDIEKGKETKVILKTIPCKYCELKKLRPLSEFEKFLPGFSFNGFSNEELDD